MSLADEVVGAVRDDIYCRWISYHAMTYHSFPSTTTFTLTTFQNRRLLLLLAIWYWSRFLSLCHVLIVSLSCCFDIVVVVAVAVAVAVTGILCSWFVFFRCSRCTDLGSRCRCSCRCRCLTLFDGSKALFFFYSTGATLFLLWFLSIVSAECVWNDSNAIYLC